MKKDFNHFMNTLTPQILGYENLVDVDKVIKQFKDIDVDYDTLNNMIKDYDSFYNSIDGFLDKNSDFKEYLPILFASRKDLYDLKNQKKLKLSSETTNEEAKEIIKHSPLDTLMRKGAIHDVRDYIIGIEEGMDSNARKNRTGTLMEQTVLKLLQEKGLQVTSQYSSYNLCDELGMDKKLVEEYFPGKKSKNKKAVKRFDFKFTYKNEIYVVETNFYGSTGSKLDEVSRAYIYLEDRCKSVNNLNFIWITDGAGWEKTRTQIEEAYNHNTYVFNLNDLKNNSLEELLDK